VKIKRRYTEGGKWITDRCFKPGKNLAIKQQRFVGGIPMIEMDDGMIIKPNKYQVDVVNTIQKHKILYTQPYPHCIDDVTGNEVEVDVYVVAKLIEMGVLRTKTTKISKKIIVVINEDPKEKE